MENQRDKVEGLKWQDKVGNCPFFLFCVLGFSSFASSGKDEDRKLPKVANSVI